MRTIAIVNQKGGCGKTTTAINLAAICARRGLRTLVVDMDPQSHCAAGLGVPEDAIERSIGDALLSDLSRSVNRANLVWEVGRHLDLIPSTMSLAGLEAPGGGLHGLEDRDRRLAMLLRHLAPHYDRCLIDCPPTIGLLTYNALRAAGEAIIPVETGFFALRGARKQWETIRNLVDHVSHPIAVYVLPTLYNPDERLAQDVLGSIRKQFAGRVIPVVIREHTEIREAAGMGQPVAEYAPQSQAAKDFEALATWLEEHPADPPEPQIEITRSVSMPYLREGDTPERVAVPMGAAVGGAAMGGSANEGGVTVARSGSGVEGATQGPVAENSRAAEMARRVRQMVQSRSRDESSAPPVLPGSPDPPSSPPGDLTPLGPRGRKGTLIEAKDVPPTIAMMPANIARLFGVRQTAQGVLFIQPGTPGMVITVAGEFNGWSATASTLRYNREAGVHELILPLPPGRYEYRLVIDGRWQADPYNPNRRRNQFGEDNNYFEVT